MQSAGRVVIFIDSLYSGVSWISTTVSHKSPSSSREAWTRDKSVSASGDVPTMRIIIYYFSDFSEAGAGVSHSAPSAPSSFFSLRTSTSFGTSSGTYSWNSEAITTAS